ncbi:MAG TPA: hypothetical protein PKV86_08165 [Syntrophobacteraceae bacterium]|nr:hypothetical protein [Syntrophobacteraceae bacterium]
MGKVLCIPIIVCALLFPTISWGAEAPLQIAGIQLGANIDQYKSILQMDTSLPVRHMEYLSEVEIKPPFAGYRSGYLFYGNCEKPGRIVKLKLKYEREDKEFFDDLLNQFKRKFGEPDQYRGDAFRAFLAWKWSFVDKDKNRISLILQHNSSDVEEYTMGNSVKLTVTSFVEQEARCFEQKNPETKQARSGKTQKKPGEQMDYRRFIPE